jgi:hypothetical protein
MPVRSSNLERMVRSFICPEKGAIDTIKENSVFSCGDGTRPNNMLDTLAAVRKAIGNFPCHSDGIVGGRVEAFDMCDSIREPFPVLPHCKRFTMGPPSSVSSLYVGPSNIKSQP